jgi:diguanylate cyclase (GGDEF)-like protein
VRETERVEQQLRHEVPHEQLTQLPGRELFIDLIDHEITVSWSIGSGSFAVVMVNVDRFRVLQDSLGHLSADVALCIVAERFRALIRLTATLARVGGDY